VRSANLTLRFALELTALAALGLWGFGAAEGALGIVFGLGAPLVAALVWGVLVAPHASRRLPDPWRLVTELAVWAAATVALVAGGRPALAAVFAALVLGSLTLMVLWEQRASA
jgi:hypothetical protein